jgi:hypothetical protein
MAMAVHAHSRREIAYNKIYLLTTNALLGKNKWTAVIGAPNGAIAFSYISECGRSVD